MGKFDNLEILFILQNNFDFVNNQFILKRKGFKDFINSLNEKYNYDINYSKGMKKIYESSSIVTYEGTLSKAMIFTRDHYLTLSNYHLELATNLKNEIIEPAKKVLEDQNNIGKKLYSDIKKFEKEYKDALTNLDKFKTKFFNAARSAEHAKLDAELARVSYITPQEKEKFNTKAVYLMKEAKEAENNYINQITAANRARIIFIEGSKAALYQYQLLEEEFIEFMKNLLRKIFFFGKSLHENCLFDINYVAEKVEQIDMNNDINDFIIKNQTNIIPPVEIQYLPYSLELRNKPIEDHNYPAEVVYNVIVSMNTLFEKSIDGFDAVEEKKKIQISEISKIACMGENFTEEHQNILFELLKEKKFRFYFLSYLNRYRSNGIFEITKNSYEIIGNILKQILDLVIINKDYESARYCIILSQTYHLVSDSGQKVSLQEKIEKHELLKMPDFWENFIAYSIFEEIEKQNINISNDIIESDEEKNNRISNIVFSQLLPITDNMLSFEVEKEKIKEIILRFSKQFEISSELNEHLIVMVDEFLYEPVKVVTNTDDQNKEDLLDPNFENDYVEVNLEEKYVDEKINKLKFEDSDEKTETPNYTNLENLNKIESDELNFPNERI